MEAAREGVFTRTPRVWLHREGHLTEAVTFNRETHSTHNKLSGGINTSTSLFSQTPIFCRHFPLVEHYKEPEGKGGFMQPDLVTAFQVRTRKERILEGQMKGK